ncbi:MAG: HAMP domain-containing protein, partial [Treponema sp.]|nr:HAMP domain-containing protein [Treponema sp.]
MIKIKQLLSFLFLACTLFFPALLPAQSDFYWEQPEIFSPGPGSFPVSAFNGDVSLIAWQESGSISGSGDVGDGQISVSMAIKSSGGPWQILRAIGGPYVYSGTEPSILSAALDDDGRILIAAAASSTQTEILISDDLGASFNRYRVNSGSESAVAPRIYPKAGGGYILFVTRGQDQSLSLFYALSEDGRFWSSFEPFVTEAGLQLNFLPTHITQNGVDYVVFQSFVGGADIIPAFQLFIKSSSDGGLSWTPARRITTFQDSYTNTAASVDRFDNQRPHLSIQGNNLFLVWERRLGTASPQIYGAAIQGDGTVIGLVDRINADDAYCNNPIAFQYEGQPTVIWFDSRSGANRVFLAQRWGINWQNYDLSGASGDASFARPVVDNDGLFVFWQTTAQGTNRIYSLSPDTTVVSPRLTAQNFSPSRRTSGEQARISWNIPYDPSGIMGFSYSWSMSADELPPRQILVYTGTTSAVETAREDGSWYFTIIAQDFAGNWSAPSRLEYIRDTTPPPAANIIPPPVDEEGYLPSNTFSIRWNPPPASDVAGYTWSLNYVGPTDAYASVDAAEFASIVEVDFPPVQSLPPRIMGMENAVSYTNQDDGIWRFTVSAIDEVGNIGPPSNIVFRMNKYIPYTYVTYVDSGQDEQGILSIRIIGRGFAEGGQITRIFLDRDGQPPYDREYFLDRGNYEVRSDREIAGLRIENIEEGLYRIGMEHPWRGLYMTPPLVTVDETGTVKFGDFSRIWEPSWIIRPERRYRLDTALLIIIAIVIFCAIGLAVSIRGLGSVVAESAAIRLEAIALITGDFMPSEKKRRLRKIKRRGVGLRIKLASFTIVLVLLVVFMVSGSLYYMMTRTQEETLLQGLWDRSTVLLEGLASSARAYLPSGNVLELGFLPAQTAAIPEARYVTITGFGSGTSTYDDHVWATNDPDILSKIDTAEFQPGVSRLQDILSQRLADISRQLDDQARAEVGDLSASINGLTQEALSLALRTDAASIQRLNDIQVTTRSLETRLTERLTVLARDIGSEPNFSTQTLTEDGNHLYIFFKPVMFRQGSEDIYFRGLIRLEVSIDSIIEQIAEGQRDLLQVILIVAFTALAIGTVGALLLATLIIRPIIKLVAHVERIRDTEDKEKLEGVDINIKTRDEIAVLGNTINDMTHGLVKAALASQDMTIGKEVQKKFIPLEIDREGNKLTSGFKDTKNVQFFGYYEGAKGVSGDYFDYQDLDGRYYAIIKCDVAGKGIPAALIMIQVATMFLNYFKQWKPSEKGMHIEEVV